MKKYKVSVFLGKSYCDLFDEISFPVQFQNDIESLSLESILPEGDIITREFNTISERDAYIQGARDTDGYGYQEFGFSGDESSSVSKKEKQIANLIGLINYYRSDFDLCELDGGGTGYLIGNRELRWPEVRDGRVWCESNNIHETTEYEEEIEGTYIQVRYDKMTDTEKNTLKKYLIEYIKIML